ncbi:uncharacterized protein BJ171DRAFT_582386 [Polychytrium aggregatum]|uniref:uncharacterized protein n=1 Tax=Polychytrium aggregatum TaxID=110093 RepID=UPI0022FE3022|nr:uncharacterized protein BJ171DRAFT_582386 [Polychytrium aggregatum]KAI9204009.1 hypothetical protein BJ171DRAFT_582386 [Polychytrium aggregatum]
MDASKADSRLPEYFPLKLKKCTEVSEQFFSCYEKESFPNGDPSVAKAALLTCHEQLIAYKACMDKFVGPKAQFKR